MLNDHVQTASRIVYSCYASSSRQGEQFIPDHVFGYVLSGTLRVYDGQQTYTFREGDFRFLRRNHLARFEKLPPPGGEFRSVAVIMGQEMLRNFSLEFGYTANRHHTQRGVMALPFTALYKTYMDSLSPYIHLTDKGNEALLALKVKEAVMVLLKENPAMKDILFDFSEPGKIDLEAFMQAHFHFNVEMKRFAYLTGRSLATFKRDFKKIFHSAPQRWLQQRRLQEAHYLLKEKGRKPSDIYLEVGFEDLSHFSFAFKKTFGVAPSAING